MIIQTIILILMLICCFITDLTKQKIYNWVTLPGIGLGFLINGIFSGMVGLKSAGLGFSIGFSFLFIIFLVGGMGGGDVKLMGAIGALKGYPFVISALVYSILVGGFIAFAVLIWKKKFLRTMRNIFLFLISKVFPFIHSSEMKKEEMEKVPFGIAIVIGTIWALIMEFISSKPLIFDIFNIFKL
ncbi:MAG: A24 family peptidase [candidate division WOR-3 bacterium]